MFQYNTVCALFETVILKCLRKPRDKSFSHGLFSFRLQLLHKTSFYLHNSVNSSILMLTQFTASSSVVGRLHAKYFLAQQRVSRTTGDVIM